MIDFNTWLLSYFKKEMTEGKTEFRLVATQKEDGVALMIHPMGKDGETIDLKITEEVSRYISLGPAN